MDFKIEYLFTYQLFYDYFFVCIILAFINRNEDFFHINFKQIKYLKNTILTSLIFAVPLYEWYNISYNGNYYATSYFIFQLSIGILIYITGKTAFGYIYVKKNVFISLISIISILVLLYLTKHETEYIMTFP